MSAHVEANLPLSFLLRRPCEISQPICLFQIKEPSVISRHPSNQTSERMSDSNVALSSVIPPSLEYTGMGLKGKEVFLGGL